MSGDLSTPTDGVRSEPAIEATGLVKAFRTARAVDGVDLVVPTGGVFGFLGPNGAGKTTTIRVLATLLQPDGGTARVFGHDVVREADRVRERISLTGQFASIDEELTGSENLMILARLLGFGRTQAGARADELLDGFGLTEAGGRTVKTYSGGMRRRLDIAASIIVTPDLLFLDEPTTGLDPRSRNQVWDIVRALTDEGTTVLLTTQYLDEADQLADRLAVIDHGRIIAEGTPAQLKASVGAGTVQVRVFDPAHRPEAERLLTDVLGTTVQTGPDDAALSARVDGPGPASLALAGLARAGIDVTTFALGQPSLDEVFLALTGQPARAGTDAHQEQAP
ncbi:ATP-binding cassette domain-containing protein [Micromonospora sp. 4G57]|uniref:ATP-binding cassette domain-containing protein n=1 Tax=Micromonospora sicca TaxID=2202420 RepID=A0ABU5J8S1_9ACTN|nr:MULTISPECIES: ATP-binding cassette domain-containing protein [unclassified Micromonospora]MDZ5443541.1 ATP-binding cassette domain-containing protein [Micromonospora sp. 4G57]MDZ5488986.1 ATP-binding cassette domain-containing protein [Micromonospora sp. 4G53]